MTILFGIILFPLRAAVFLTGYLAYQMEVAADWIVGARKKTEYVRTGACKRCGKCCQCLALMMPEGWSKKNLVVRAVGLWHRLAMNFSFIAEEEGWLVYQCDYYSSDHCSIYPFRHRLCRFFPRQRLYGHPNVHADCGFKFVRRDVFEKKIALKNGDKATFDEHISKLSSPGPESGLS